MADRNIHQRSNNSHRIELAILMETLYTTVIFAVLLLLIGVPYWLKAFRHRKEAKQIHGKTVKAGLGEPVTLHPKIDITTCIGCASCVKICPESVLGIVDCRAAVISGLRCVGHSLCADVCPVGAITMTFGKPRAGMEIPLYDENYKTNIDGLYIVGELGGIGLIRNAIEQGKKAIEHIASMPRHRVKAYSMLQSSAPDRRVSVLHFQRLKLQT